MRLLTTAPFPSVQEPLPDTLHDETRDIPGIVIRDWAPRPGQGRIDPRVPAFVYGESLPVLPTLPFGRWKTVA